MADVAKCLSCSGCGSAMAVSGGYGDKYLTGACPHPGCQRQHWVVADGWPSAGQVLTVGPTPEPEPPVSIPTLDPIQEAAQPNRFASPEPAPEPEAVSDGAE